MGDDAKNSGRLDRTTNSSGLSQRDAELVHLARRGDKQAFVEIVARHQALVCGIALGILGDFAASEDAGQEAFLTAWRRFADLREPDRLRSWLGRIARNTALTHLRRRRRGESLESVRAFPDDSPPPDESAASTEETRLVREHLDQLPETYRLPLVLYYREGQSVKAVADALDISENAAKKRLERGRQMLREQLTGLVESVLTRTAPTSVFTMTVAAAIGALTAPAAVAGGVYAAATATASTTTATQSFSTTLTAMSASKSMLVTTALVVAVCVPIGLQIPQPVAPTPSVAPAKTTPLVASREPERSSDVLVPDSELFREWQRLHELHGHSPSAMPLLHTAIAGLESSFQRRAFNTALVAEWVELDPTGGFEFYMTKVRDSSWRRQFLQEWLRRDPNAAVDALLARKKGWQNLARTELGLIVELAPARLPEVVAALPVSENSWNRDVAEAFTKLADRNFEVVRESAEKMTGPNRDQALAGVAASWARRDWESALKWARELPEGVDRDEIIRAGLVSLAGIDPATALDQMGSVPPGGHQYRLASTTGSRVLKAAATADFDATLEWITANPGRLGQKELGSLDVPVTRMLNTDAADFLTRYSEDGSLSPLLPAIRSAILNSASDQQAAIWEWTQTQPDSPEVEALRKSVLTYSGFKNPEFALRLGGELPDTGKGREDASQIARSIWDGGKTLHQFDSWYEEASEQFRPHLASAAFRMLGPKTLSDPQNWVERLERVPNSGKRRATVSLANAWGNRAPEDAINWVGTLPDDANRREALGAVASTWARQDAHGAAEWINTLPPGDERDQSTISLVNAVVDQHPVTAWDWALSVESENARGKLAADVVRSVAAIDRVTARQWIVDGPFSPSQRTQLIAELNNSNHSNSATGNRQIEPGK
jgi:RNA polymerase sigma factor (sigma-70 family)